VSLQIAKHASALMLSTAALPARGDEPVSAALRAALPGMLVPRWRAAI
jgi:hypothetical protein